MDNGQIIFFQTQGGKIEVRDTQMRLYGSLQAIWCRCFSAIA